ncbi:insulin-like growth factor-binding protein 5 [Microtus oregoni]|uniref:insulin-like growth factor-binding protein 5 n=1 Tax=Microtus oregoni TaxID=111838 RepID=UPI001BB2C673|nr:insulin-like growth factor-binding protein 5 [Microtus oregoni]XP_049979719.1 insulin-like growth factor-binding protein 5 [Microtus fortis]
MVLSAVLLLLAAYAGPAQGLGSFVHCEPCDEKALSMCPPSPLGCELVKEPGCGCCMTCALAEGQSCGVYTERCAQDLRCLPRQDEEKPLHALLHGRGVCLSEKSYSEQTKIERDSREHEEPTTSEMAEETYSPKVFRPKHTRISELKAEAVKKDRRKKLTQSKFVGGAENTAHSRVVPAPEMRQESEQGPCRRHMEASLQELKASPRMVPRAVYLPNCDRKGFYKRKQCKPSRGRKRGICWCVDKYGMKLPGMEYVDGDFQCHSFDSSNVE